MGEYLRPFVNGYDSYLFHNGTNYQVYQKMGAHPCVRNGRKGTSFSLWAPAAKEVHVITGRTGWNENEGKMRKTRYEIWECFIPGVGPGDNYRFVITGADGVKRYKADPYAFWAEERPENASIVSSLKTYTWHDRSYLEKRKGKDDTKLPVSIYEVHLGSWKKDYRKNEEGFLNYGELAEELSDYCVYMGYTHVELMGICEHPFDGSWGYQVTGYFAPTSRHGCPDDFRYFVDRMHEKGIGVILDWVPAHFPKDDFSLSKLDGTNLYEPEDPLLAEYPEWGTYAFDHGKPEVKSFLLSSAFYWIREFHIDALRVDAVASMLYRSFGRKEWTPSPDGSDIDYESIAFLKELNKAVTEQTDAYLIAEDSSIMSGITAPVSEGGMGFRYKWSLGWMNDSLRYIEKDSIYRKYDHYEITKTFDYAFTENFILVLSHDEVVHLKKPMLLKMPGPMEEKFGTLKSFYTYQFTSPGKKLMFMGSEFGELREWDEGRDIDWNLPNLSEHRDLMECVRRLNGVYRNYPVLHDDSGNPVTFEWINSNDAERNIFSYIRRNPWNYEHALLVIINFSPVDYPEYSLGVPLSGEYRRIFSTEEDMADVRETAVCENCDYRDWRLTVPLRKNESVIYEFPIN